MTMSITGSRTGCRSPYGVERGPAPAVSDRRCQRAASPSRRCTVRYTVERATLKSSASSAVDMRAGRVQLQQMSLLGVGEFRLFSAEAPLRFGDLHAFACSGANQIGLEFGNHREAVEEEAPDRIVRIVDGASDAELHLLRGELVDDVFRISERTCQPVEFGDDQGVTASACGKSFPKARSSAVGAGEAMVGVDQGRSHTQSFQGVLLGREILFVCGYAGVSNQ